MNLHCPDPDPFDGLTSEHIQKVKGEITEGLFGLPRVVAFLINDGVKDASLLVHYFDERNWLGYSDDGRSKIMGSLNTVLMGDTVLLEALNIRRADEGMLPYDPTQ